MIFDSLPYNLINQKINLNLIWDSRLQIIQNQKERCRYIYLICYFYLFILLKNIWRSIVNI